MMQTKWHSPFHGRHQGKMFYRPKQFMHQASLWKLPERRMRVSGIVHRKQLTVDSSVKDPLAGRAAMGRLVSAMTHHYEALFVYHELWLGLRVIIRQEGPFHAVPAARTLLIPVDFEEEDLVDFVQEHWDAIHAMALADAKERASAEERRKRRAASRAHSKHRWL